MSDWWRRKEWIIITPNCPQEVSCKIRGILAEVKNSGQADLQIDFQNGNTVVMENVEKKMRPIERAGYELGDEMLHKYYGIISVGIASDCLYLYSQKRLRAWERNQLPREWQGFLVKYQYTGPVKAFC